MIKNLSYLVNKHDSDIHNLKEKNDNKSELSEPPNHGIEIE
jgi:hypothetical protein